MATGKMYECEVKRPFVRDGVRTLEWVMRPVKEITDGSQIRCMHCHGEVRIHRQRVAHGPRDHVEHRSGKDSEHCRGGSLFRGDDADHKGSNDPVR